MADTDFVWDSGLVQNLVAKIDALNGRLRGVEEDTRLINRRQEALQLKLSDFPELYDLKQRIKPLVQLWETIAQFNTMVEEWKEKPLRFLSVEEVEEFCSEWYRKLLYVMRNSNLTKHAGPKAFADYIMREIENIRMYLPLLGCLKIRGLERRHFQTISKEVGEQVWLNRVTFRFLAKRDLHKGRKFDIIKNITDQASKEYAIRLTIEAVENELDNTQLSAVRYRDSYILKNLQRDLSNFTECTLKINSIASNPAARTFKERIERILKELNRINYFFSMWNDLQKFWAYLLPIFAQRDISTHMPEQYKRFVEIDSIYRREVAVAESQCRTYRAFSRRPDLKDHIQKMTSQFEYLMKCLIKYLEAKREYFPRLFFLSNEQIIEIVGMLEDISQLELNLFKMFEGIDKLIIVYDEDYKQLQAESRAAESGVSLTTASHAGDSKKKTKAQGVRVWRAQDTRLFKQGLQTCLGTRPVRELGADLGRILGVQNQDGELLEFMKPIKITESIEQWLKRVEYAMKFNVSRTVQSARDSFESLDFGEWIKLWPTQFLLIVLEIETCRSLERIFDHEIRRLAHRKAIEMAKDRRHQQQLLVMDPPRPLRDEYGRDESTTQAFKKFQEQVRE